MSEREKLRQREREVKKWEEGGSQWKLLERERESKNPRILIEDAWDS